MPRALPLLTLVALLACIPTDAHAQRAGAARERQVAVRFAPVFRQALGDHPRADYITNFDFDGDWRGNNNWANTDDRRFKLRAYVYFSVSETQTHFFIHYAVFHPRDYKGGNRTGPLISEAIREGVKRAGRYDPTGLSQAAVMAHENDMEGCLVVVAKEGSDLARAQVVLIETLAHDRFLKYSTAAEATPGTGRVRLEGQSPLLYIEPKGHGISAYDGSEQDFSRDRILIYRFTGRADDPEVEKQDKIGYELIPLFNTVWPRAQASVNETFGTVMDYGVLAVKRVGAHGKMTLTRKRIGKLGAAFLGGFGAPNAARPPWGWFDREEREQPRGAWFFDPASTVKRQLNLGEGFSTVYQHAPFIGIFRQAATF